MPLMASSESGGADARLCSEFVISAVTYRKPGAWPTLRGKGRGHGSGRTATLAGTSDGERVG
ncbi:hypothetical protein SBV1_1770014 [Verrucomicrobia bacterium]|nr:hypothetical protein SBV1_1770014 [Verrucomicrobiota bacterium]